MTPSELAEIHEKCFAHPRPWGKHEFAELLTSDAIFISPHPHGFALGRIAGPEAELLTIAVNPDYQRKGIAKQIMQNFQKTASDKGVTEVYLEVDETNDPAIGLYQQFGFKLIAQRKNYYRTPSGERVTALAMCKTL